MTLRRLTGLEAGKLREEQAVLNTKIADISDLLQKRDRILQASARCCCVPVCCVLACLLAVCLPPPPWLAGPTTPARSPHPSVPLLLLY